MKCVEIFVRQVDLRKMNDSLYTCRSRGLSQLLHSKSIRTIGDLCSLSEYDVHLLPIRSPKVANLKKVMAKYEAKLQAKLHKQRLMDTDMGEGAFHSSIRLHISTIL